MGRCRALWESSCTAMACLAPSLRVRVAAFLRSCQPSSAYLHSSLNDLADWPVLQIVLMANYSRHFRAPLQALGRVPASREQEYRPCSCEFLRFLFPSSEQIVAQRVAFRTRPAPYYSPADAEIFEGCAHVRCPAPNTSLEFHARSRLIPGRVGRFDQNCSGTARTLGCRNNAQHLHARDSRLAACGGRASSGNFGLKWTQIRQSLGGLKFSTL